MLFRSLRNMAVSTSPLSWPVAEPKPVIERRLAPAGCAAGFVFSVALPISLFCLSVGSGLLLRRRGRFFDIAELNIVQPAIGSATGQ